MRRPPLRLAWLTCAGFIAAVCALIYLAGFRPLTVDEIEYFRATHWIAHGRLPYRDFWEHHLPLQWYLFAPVAAFLNSAGAASILAMRFAQLPLWLLTFWAFIRWCRNAGFDRERSALAVAASLAAPLFVMPAIEFRVDTVSTCAVICALALAHRRDASTRSNVAAGALLSISVLANLRFTPVAAAALLAFLFIDVERTAWRMPRLKDAAAMIGGGAIPAVLYAAFLALTGSFPSFWADVVVGNARMNALMSRYAVASLRTTGGLILRSFDLAAVFLIAGGLAAIAIAAFRWRRPGRLHVLAVIVVASLASIVRMPVQYLYHFELPLLLCAALAVFAIDAFPEARRQALYTIATGVVILAAVLDVIFVGNTSLERLRVQDGVMRNADDATAPGDRVWDATGFALRREPAYRYWFLPLGVRLRAAAGEIAPYSPADMAAAPPAAVIIDLRMFSVLREWPSTRRAVIQHYVPRWRNVWLPGTSGVIAPTAIAAVEIWRSGPYRLIAGVPLLEHPWFRNPVACASASGSAATALTIDTRALPVARGIAAQRGGELLDTSAVWNLRRGDRVYIRNSSAQAVGFFLAPASAKLLFEAPPNGAPLTDPLFELR